MGPSIIQPTEPVLVYTRIAQNRRKTIMLVAIAILSIVPFIGGIAFGAAEYVVTQFGHSMHLSDSEKANLKFAMVQQRLAAANSDANSSADVDEATRHLQAELDAVKSRHRDEIAANDKLRWQLMALFAAALSMVLGLLFWGFMSSPTSKVLAMCGARPSGAEENEARRLLENLAIGAGLPVPKLYVIDSPVPNAFAAGIDPEHAVIAVTSGLLGLMDHRELEGVLAHEMSHIGNRDTRLNTVVTSIALFLRLPYLMRKRSKQQSGANWGPVKKRMRLPYLALLPVYIYVFFIAPVLAAIIRAAISRGREYLADADAALLTRYPEGLLRALAKIRGAGSDVGGTNTVISHLYFADSTTASGLMGLFTGNLLATHPPIEARINRLMEFGGRVPVSVLEAAAKAGVDFKRDHPALSTGGSGLAAAVHQDELAVFTKGNPLGRVHRVLSATKIYDRPDPKSAPVANVPAGALVVVFDDPGKYRQVLTHDQTFGYMPRTIKIQQVDMLPAEIHDPAARAKVQAAQPAANAVAAAAVSTDAGGLTHKQIAIAAAFFLAIFAGLFVVLLKFGGS